MLETRVIERDGFRFVVSRANVRLGLKRAKLRRAAFGEISNDAAREEFAFRVFFYPDITAAAIEFDGVDLSDFDAFMEMPEDVVDVLLRAVYELNPHWVPEHMRAQFGLDDTEKKDGTPDLNSTTASSNT